MNQVMVRYTVRPDQAGLNENLVQQVYQELSDAAPDGLRYATFVLEDGVSFVHLATVDTEDGHNPLMELPAFTAFQRDIADRCIEPPAAVSVRTVGAYRFHDDQPGA